MKRLIISLHCCFMLFAVVARSSAESPDVPKLSDYAWAFPIVVDEEASFYSIRLTLDVYQSVTDPDLRDAGVYNAAGRPVPRVFEPANDDVEQIEQFRQLPMLPLYAATESHIDDIKLLFERDRDSTRLELNSGEFAASAEDQELTSYIVDTRQVEEAIEFLEFAWDQIEPGFIGRIMIDGSNDFQGWELLGSGAVAQLREDSTSIVQRRVALQKSKHDFLRIRWQDMPENWRLSHSQGGYVLGVSNIVRESVTLEADSIDTEDGGRIFQLGGAPKIDSIRLVLTEPNTVISARIFFWSEYRHRWMQAGYGSYHHIGRGSNTVMSEALPVANVRSSRFKVIVTRGQPDVAMRLEVGWRPDTLLFLAQGSAPFTLAAGRASDAENNFPQQRMYGVRSIAGLAENNGRATDASLGPRYALGGPDRLRVEQAINWRTFALWVALALGVTFVGFMASKVIRDLKSGA